MVISNKYKLIYHGSVILTLGLGLIVISGITSVLSKLFILYGIINIGYGIYKLFYKDDPVEVNNVS